MYLSDSTYNLTNGDFEAGSVALGYPASARINQYGGSVTITNLGFASYIDSPIQNGYLLYGGTLNLPGGMLLLGEPGGLSYLQAGGTNQTTQVTIEVDYGAFFSTFTLNGGLLADSGVKLMAGYKTPLSAAQNGGLHVITNTLFIAGSSANGSSSDPATYNLNGGEVSAGVIELDADDGDSVFVQSNGTVSAGTVYAHSVGYYGLHNTIITLSDGTLSCSNYTTDDGGGQLNQSGGALVVSNLLDFGGSRNTGAPYPLYGTYTFTGGSVTASNINISGVWIIGDGLNNQISNPGFFSLSHLLNIGNDVEQLGQFILAGTNATIELTGSASQLRFANSSSQTWSNGAVLNIDNWNGSLSGGGADQLFFGSDKTGLTSQQLSQMQFVNPKGLPSGTYSARLLSDGEVVPNQGIQPTVAFSLQENNMVLNWPTGWTLQSSANVAGPYNDVAGSSSPYTNDMTTRPQQFFRLRQ